MFQTLPIALAQVKRGKISEIYCMKSAKSDIFCIKQKELLKISI